MHLRWRTILGLGVVLFAVICAWGCATGSKAGGNDGASKEREPPPEVADHTVDGEQSGSATLRPRVDVRIDRGELVGVEMGSYEAQVRRKVQSCYSRQVRRRDTRAEGGLVYEVLVTRNGRVAGTDLMSSDIRDEAVRNCVEHVIGRLRFDVPVRNRPLYRLFFRFDLYLETIVPSDPPV